jgi:hypothetical protein
MSLTLSAASSWRALCSRPSRNLLRSEDQNAREQAIVPPHDWDTYNLSFLVSHSVISLPWQWRKNQRGYNNSTCSRSQKPPDTVGELQNLQFQEVQRRGEDDKLAQHFWLRDVMAGRGALPWPPSTCPWTPGKLSAHDAGALLDSFVGQSRFRAYRGSDRGGASASQEFGR